jgi:hypothetical protein
VEPSLWPTAPVVAVSPSSSLLHSSCAVPGTLTFSMTDNIYLLSSAGKCANCEESAAEKDIVKCSVCENQFHALCKLYDKDSAIALKTFFQMFKNAKANFCWQCDKCLTKAEENIVATVNEKIGALSTKVDSLADSLQKVVNLVTNNTDELTQSITSTIDDKIAGEFVQLRSKLSEEMETLRKSEQTIDPPPEAAKTVWDMKEKVKEVRTSLLAKRNAESGSSVDIEKLEKAAIKNGIPVNSVHVTESGDTFVNLPNKASSDKLQPLLQEMNHDVVTLKSKLPTIALLGVTQEYSKTEIVHAILSQNEIIRGLVEESKSHLSVVYTKEPNEGNPYHQVVLRVSPDIRRAINNNSNKLHMGRVLHRVVNRFYIRRCNNCQYYGHYQDKCPTPNSPVCGYCSQEGHLSKNCPIKSGPTTDFCCHNCKSRDIDFKGHSTFWHNCPSYKEQQKKLEHSIDYDYSNS